MPWTIGLRLLNSTQPSKSGRAVDPDGVVQARTVPVVSSQPVRIALPVDVADSEVWRKSREMNAAGPEGRSNAQRRNPVIT